MGDGASHELKWLVWRAEYHVGTVSYYCSGPKPDQPVGFAPRRQTVALFDGMNLK